jgi:hypothetical protein
MDQDDHVSDQGPTILRRALLQVIPLIILIHLLQSLALLSRLRHILRLLLILLFQDLVLHSRSRSFLQVL